MKINTTYRNDWKLISFRTLLKNYIIPSRFLCKYHLIEMLRSVQCYFSLFLVMKNKSDYLIWLIRVADDRGCSRVSPIQDSVSDINSFLLSCNNKVTYALCLRGERKMMGAIKIIWKLAARYRLRLSSFISQTSKTQIGSHVWQSNHFNLSFSHDPSSRWDLQMKTTHYL